MRYLKLNLKEPVPTDIDVSRAQKPKEVSELAQELQLLPSEIDFYGKTKAKISLSVLDRLKDCTPGKYIVVGGWVNVNGHRDIVGVGRVSVSELAQELQLLPSEIDFYGKTKAKISLSVLDRLKDCTPGKYMYIVVGGWVNVNGHRDIVGMGGLRAGPGTPAPAL